MSIEEADLVVIEWQGREKLHYLNPLPIQEIYERWIGKYERSRLQALSVLTQSLEMATVGWMAILNNLKTLLETGQPLRYAWRG